MPAGWGFGAKEGFVVRFGEGPNSWVGNFRRGIWGVEEVLAHPNGCDVLVFASGDCWQVRIAEKTAEFLLPAVDSLLEVDDPAGFVMSRQGLALARLGPGGVMWHTKRLSWDGIVDLEIRGDRVVGKAWWLDDAWREFEVDIQTGASHGGSFGDNDTENWERLATLPT